MAGPEVKSPRDVNEPPPVGGSWRNVYAFVLGTLAVVIAALWVLTAVYR